MSRLPRIAAYSGLSLSLLLLLDCCSVERGRVSDHLPDASIARVIFLVVGCVAVAVSLAVLCVHDVRQFFGDSVGRLALSESEEEVTPAPPLEEAAKIRKSEPLEAIRVLREFLNQNSGEVQAMLGIAEIYEQNLHNPLAAALEYEELLKQKLDPERWGGLAIHLTNLYIRLKQPDKAIALLRRIDQECGNTAAAVKARKRLGQVDESEASP
jgi:thioredoxin-like negative regulator of GroEL